MMSSERTTATHIAANDTIIDEDEINEVNETVWFRSTESSQTIVPNTTCLMRDLERTDCPVKRKPTEYTTPREEQPSHHTPF